MRGFSLIELIASISIFVISATFFLLIEKASFNAIKKNELLLKDLYQAQNIMESFYASEFQDLIENGCGAVESVDDDKKIITVKVGGIVLETIRTK